MALGASPADLLRLVGGYSVKLTAAGTAIGLAGAALTTSLMGDLVQGVRPADPVVFAGTAAFLAMLACLIPAVRATRVDPNAALRAQ